MACHSLRLVRQDPNFQPDQWPIIRTAGFDGFLVSFSDRLNEPANRAALAFRGALDRAGWSGLVETTTSLVSTYLRFDPDWLDHEGVLAKLQALLADRDWFAAPLPDGRKLWRVPTVYGTAMAPQLEEAAAMAGITPEEAIADLSRTRVRVQTIGFAPGQAYLGELPPAWDIPRQTELTPQVPVGALTVAIRQIVLFSVSAPTGWRHAGQTGLQLFQRDAAEPFLLRAGDEVIFEQTTPEKLVAMRASDALGGSTSEPLA